MEKAIYSYFKTDVSRLIPKNYPEVAIDINFDSSNTVNVAYFFVPGIFTTLYQPDIMMIKAVMNDSGSWGQVVINLRFSFWIVRAR